MPVFYCKKCAQKMRAADNVIGKQCRCKKCNTLTTIPAVDEPAPARLVGQSDEPPPLPGSDDAGEPPPLPGIGAVDEPPHLASRQTSHLLKTTNQNLKATGVKASSSGRAKRILAVAAATIVLLVAAGVWHMKHHGNGYSEKKWREFEEQGKLTGLTEEEVLKQYDNELRKEREQKEKNLRVGKTVPSDPESASEKQLVSHTELNQRCFEWLQNWDYAFRGAQLTWQFSPQSAVEQGDRQLLEKNAAHMARMSAEARAFRASSSGQVNTEPLPPKVDWTDQDSEKTIALRDKISEWGYATLCKTENAFSSRGAAAETAQRMGAGRVEDILKAKHAGDKPPESRTTGGGASTTTTDANN